MQKRDLTPVKAEAWPKIPAIVAAPRHAASADPLRRAPPGRRISRWRAVGRDPGFQLVSGHPDRVLDVVSTFSHEAGLLTR